MNIEEYISSGIIESYVLGIASEAEREEFERCCNLYPRVAEARNTFEVTLERHILSGSRRPPQYVRAQLLPKIKALPTLQPYNARGVQNGPVRIAGYKSNWGAKFMAAAAVLVIILGGYFLYRLKVQNDSLAQTNQQLLAKFNNTDSTLSSLLNGLSPKGNKSIATVHLAGTAAPVRPQADIYWDSASSAVYMVAKNLPPLPADKQYQLWAQIGGKPMSLGMFEGAGSTVILKMNGTKKADAFAITVEPKTGNALPKK